jgi:hypothetical protein
VVSDDELAAIAVGEVIVSPGKGTDSLPLEDSVDGDTRGVFEPDTTQVCVFWRVEQMPFGVRNGVEWIADGESALTFEQSSIIWRKSPTDRPNWCVSERDGGPLRPGLHRIRYLAQDRLLFEVEFIITDG